MIVLSQLRDSLVRDRKVLSCAHRPLGQRFDTAGDAIRVERVGTHPVLSAARREPDLSTWVAGEWGPGPGFPEKIRRGYRVAAR